MTRTSRTTVLAFALAIIAAMLALVLVAAGMAMAQQAPDDPADLALHINYRPATPKVGKKVTITITITNNGPDPATNVVMNGNITNGGHKVTGTGSTQSCSTGQTFEECSASLPAGAALKQTFFGIPKEPQRVEGYAVATSDTSDSNEDNNWDSFSFRVRPR
jgi:uncharacterized repeat protein (TIGR01451 family)